MFDYPRFCVHCPRVWPARYVCRVCSEITQLTFQEGLEKANKKIHDLCVALSEEYKKGWDCIYRPYYCRKCGEEVPTNLREPEEAAAVEGRIVQALSNLTQEARDRILKSFTLQDGTHYSTVEHSS